jgi:hypothetical protein
LALAPFALAPFVELVISIPFAGASTLRRPNSAARLSGSLRRCTRAPPQWLQLALLVGSRKRPLDQICPQPSHTRVGSLFVIAYHCGGDCPIMRV